MNPVFSKEFVNVEEMKEAPSDGVDDGWEDDCEDIV